MEKFDKDFHLVLSGLKFLTLYTLFNYGSLSSVPSTSRRIVSVEDWVSWSLNIERDRWTQGSICSCYLLAKSKSVFSNGVTLTLSTTHQGRSHVQKLFHFVLFGPLSLSLTVFRLIDFEILFYGVLFVSLLVVLFLLLRKGPWCWV